MNGLQRQQFGDRLITGIVAGTAATALTLGGVGVAKDLQDKHRPSEHGQTQPVQQPIPHTYPFRR